MDFLNRKKQHISSIANKRKTSCSGCNACAEVCPKHCIEMITDKKGFLYPKVDTETCINCGACAKVCPFEIGNIELNPPITAYAAWNKNKEQYHASSSGGAAYVLSSYIVKEGGVVYGCASEGLHIHHIRVDSIQELPKLQGSKYVQSDVRGLYSKVKSDLKIGRPVIFIGTPCQVAGLKKYLRQIPDYMYFVDLICHGVPSQQMLREHINYVLNNQVVEHLSFRKGSMFRIELTSHCESYSSEPHKDMYFQAFLTGISYRKSCYQCPFTRKERVGDVTIGDFWRLKDATSLPLKISDGVSVLLPTSEKGAKLINAVKPNMYVYERAVQEAVDGNAQLNHPVHNGLSAKLLSILYPFFPFDKAVRIATIKNSILEYLKCLLRPLRSVLMPIINVIRR